MVRLSGNRDPMGLQSEAPLTTEEISRLVDLIRSHSGIDYHPGKANALCNAVIQRMHQLDIQSKHEFLRLIEGRRGEEELKKLVSLVVVQKTSFFRDRPQFELMERTILPKIASQRKERIVRVWSAGCATGEEPYSIAMVLRRNSFADNGTTILATDIARPAITAAMDGRYLASELESLNQNERALFLSEGGAWRLSSKIRGLVKFKLHNLVSVPYPVPPDGLWDIIFCRNVLIYFNKELQGRVLRLFTDSLVRGGFLCLGNKENLMFTEVFDEYEPVDDKARIYRKLALP